MHNFNIDNPSSYLENHSITHRNTHLSLPIYLYSFLFIINYFNRHKIIYDPHSKICPSASVIINLCINLLYLLFIYMTNVVRLG